MHFHINQLNASGRLSYQSSQLSAYPFQFDISALGEVSVKDVKGLIYGSRISSAGRPEGELMVRWWVARQGEVDIHDPVPAMYPLTLKLRIRDADGIEFNPARQHPVLCDHDKMVAMLKAEG